jgi:hypothetical protein
VPLLVVLVLHIPLSIDLLQQLMLQLLSLFGSYFSKLILLFSVYIGCFTATAKIIREVVDILIHYNIPRTKFETEIFELSAVQEGLGYLTNP